MASLVSVYRGVLLYGDSGSGKSSLVNAGLIPEAMRLGFAPERLRVQPRTSEELVVERIRSSDDDEEELLPSVLALDEESPARTVLAMDAFEERVRAACERHRLLLIFDQFEEIVTLFDEARASDAQRRLVELLVRLLRGSLPVKVLLAFREDYLGKVRELLSACPELVDQALRIAPPRSDALPEIISGPFERYPDHFARQLSPALAGRLVTVLAERFGAGDISLSEVQTVCLRLWQSDNPGELLTERGPQGLLEDYLGEALDGMPAPLRPAAIVLLAQMVTSAGTRNVISAGDLFQRVQQQEGGITPSLLDQALEGLSQSRLVRRERRRDLDLYEITSEFLVPWISRRRDEFRQSQDRRRERRRLLILGLIAAALVMVAAVVALLALNAREAAVKARDEAARAAREARTATAFALASAAQANTEKGPDVGLLLSLAALAPSRAGPAALAVARSSMIQALETTRLEGVVGILHGDTGPVDGVAFSPDGHTLATASADGSARLWDVATHRQLGSPLTANTIPVSSVAFSPDGHRLATASADGSARLWDVATHRQLASPLTANTLPISSVALSPDGRTLAVGGLVDGTVRLTVLAAPPGYMTVPLGSPRSNSLKYANSLAFSPSGRVLAAATSNGTVRLWDLATLRQLGSPLTAGAASVNTVAFSPDGHTLAAATSNGTVRLWDLATHKPLGSLRTASAASVNTIAFSPDGRVLAAATSNGTVRLWDLATLRQLGSPLTAGAASVNSVAFSPDGRVLASASDDGTVELWDVATAEHLGSPLTANASSVTTVAFSPDWRVLAVGGFGGRVRLWDVADPAHPHLLSGPLTSANAGRVTSLAFSPDGHTLASGYEQGTIGLWDVADPAHPHLLSGPLTNGGPLTSAIVVDVTSLAFSPDGRTLASGYFFNNFVLWDVADPAHPRRLGGPLTSADATDVTGFAFSPDGRTLASASQYGTVRLWDVATRTPLGSPPTAYTESVTSVAFSPDGRTLASASGGTVRLWDVATHTQLGGPLTSANAANVTSVAFSPDGRTLASGSDNGTVQLWDLATHTQLGLPLTSNTGPVASVAFSPDGGALTSVSASATVRRWRGFAWRDFTQLRNQVCSLAGTGLSRTEWALYAPGIAYQDNCP